jgi:hypothetical protein
MFLVARPIFKKRTLPYPFTLKKMQIDFALKALVSLNKNLIWHSEKGA